MVKYTRLWETMQRKGISQYRLIKTYGISNGQLNRLRKNLYISTHTVETLCRILDCRVEDVMEIVFDESDELLWSPGLEEERQKQEELEKKKKIIDSAINNLNTVMQAASQQMYQGGQQAGPQGAQGGQQAQGGNDGAQDVQEADFEEVK